jgi:cytochrome b6-f complex iron-sulfur subunit
MSTRREFIHNIASLAGITVIGSVVPIFTGCADATSSTGDNTPKTLTVSVASLTSDFTALRSSAPNGDPILIVRLAADSYTTLLLVCTHQGCRGNDLTYASFRITCSCHGSQFLPTGAVAAGPASTDLKSFPTTYDAATATVTITFS